MPGQYSKSFGNIRQPIQKYQSIIERNLLPALNDIDVSMNTNPMSTRQTSLAYSGEALESRVVLEFYSNHVELQSYDKKEPVLFVKTYYRSKGNAAGVINLNNISEAVDLIHSSLYELGFRTSDDLKQEELEKQQAEELEKQKAAEEKEKLSQKVKNDLDNINNQPEIEEPEEGLEDEIDETETSINEFSNLFDRYLNEFKKRKKINDQMIISITMSTDNNSFKVLSINLYYISDSMCLIQTSGINPKQDTNTTWIKAKNYAIAVTKKVNGVIDVSAMDDAGRDIELPAEDDTSSDTDIDVTL